MAGAVMLVADKDKILDVETVGYSDLATKKQMTANDVLLDCLNEQGNYERRAYDLG